MVLDHQHSAIIATHIFKDFRRNQASGSVLFRADDRFQNDVQTH